MKHALSIFFWIFTSVFSAMISGPEGAQAETYFCNINEVGVFSGTGTLRSTPLSDVFSADSIVVDTSTGRVLHPFFGNQSLSNTQVLDFGSAGSAFKVLSWSRQLGGREPPPFVNTLYFQVNTFEYPVALSFIALTNAEIATGLCQ